MAKWEVREQEDGTAMLYRNRRFVSVHADPDLALAYAERKKEPGDSLTHEAPDGYRTPKGRRRGWRQ